MILSIKSLHMRLFLEIQTKEKTIEYPVCSHAFLKFLHIVFQSMHFCAFCEDTLYNKIIEYVVTSMV